MSQKSTDAFTANQAAKDIEIFADRLETRASFLSHLTNVNDLGENVKDIQEEIKECRHAVNRIERAIREIESLSLDLE